MIFLSDLNNIKSDDEEVSECMMCCCCLSFFIDLLLFVVASSFSSLVLPGEYNFDSEAVVVQVVQDTTPACLSIITQSNNNMYECWLSYAVLYCMYR